MRPAGFNSASYKKKKNCDEPSSTAAFGYVVDGFNVLEELTKDDTIISIDVLEGIENLKLNA